MGGFKVVQNSFYVHVPLMVLKGEEHFIMTIMTIILIISIAELLSKKSALFIRKGPLK